MIKKKVRTHLSYECENYNHVDCTKEIVRKTGCNCDCHRCKDNPRYHNVYPSKKERVIR